MFDIFIINSKITTIKQSITYTTTNKSFRTAKIEKKNHIIKLFTKDLGKIHKIKLFTKK